MRSIFRPTGRQLGSWADLPGELVDGGFSRENRANGARAIDAIIWGINWGNNWAIIENGEKTEAHSDAGDSYGDANHARGKFRASRAASPNFLALPRERGRLARKNDSE